MGSQWQNFLLNRGEWQGSFTSLSAEGVVTDSTPSILILEPADEERLVRFHLRRYGSGSYDDQPTREVRTDYRTLGRQVVFFDTGSFSKGSLQLAPKTPSGAEFGFIATDRRFRLVQLFNDDGGFDGHVLIREFRAGSTAQERPALTLESLCGHWCAQISTISSDWPVPDLSTSEIRIERSLASGDDGLRIETSAAPAEASFSVRSDGESLLTDGPCLRRLQLLPDGGYSLIPLQESHRQAFSVEAGWMPAPDRLERLIRRYDASGAWISSTQILATRV